ncbi:TetR family transcriptional regulator C-terminal domain-containing protein, partial [Pseudomonas aeruginosa]|nr:TetR family transcriptional regulator C-terminal domain-containing protein [Pseudomonas aeruginosa]
ESCALGGWQLARLTGQAGLDASDYRQAAENIVRLVCAGCLALPGEAAPRRRFPALAG